MFLSRAMGSKSKSPSPSPMTQPPPGATHASKPTAPATSKRTPPGATRLFAADLDELAAAAELLVLDPEV